MRITTQITLQHAIDRMQSSASQMDKYRRQATSGKKIDTPSDDPQVAVRSIQLRSAVATHKAYVDSGKVTQERLGVNDAALADIVTTLNHRHHTQPLDPGRAPGARRHARRRGAPGPRR